MHRPRPIHSLLSLLVALGLVLTPAMTRSASAAKPAAAAPKKKAASQTKASRSAAAKKGWETRRMGEKANANWAARTAANPKLKNNKKAEATFKARSMASQKSAARRSKSSATAMKPGKAQKSARKVKRNKAAAKKAAKRAKQAKRNKKNSGAVAEEEIDDEDGIDAEDDDFTDVIENAGFDEATMAEAGDAFAEADELYAAGEHLEALNAAIYGHELMAYEAELAAQDYDADGEHDQAESIRLFGAQHTKAATKLKSTVLPAEEGAELDDDGDQAEVDDEVEQPRAQRATGFFGKMKANRAARASFKQMVREDGGMRGEYNRLKSEKRSWKTGFFTGLSAVAFVKNILPIAISGVVTTGGAIFAGLGAVGLASAGIREYKLRDASRKELVKDLYASGELEPHEIQTYQAAGWL